jgi:hypothetical protein
MKAARDMPIFLLADKGLLMSRGSEMMMARE